MLILYWRPKDYTLLVIACQSYFGLLHEFVQNPKSQGEREREREESKGEKHLLVVFEWSLGFMGCCGS